MVKDVQRHVESLGWTAAAPTFWENLQTGRPRVAFLAPPLDTIPSPSGNAIYCLVERLVERLGTSAMAMAIAPDSVCAKETPILDRLLYYHRSLKPSLPLRLLPYRAKKLLYGSGAPELLEYGRSAGAVLNALQIPVVVVEDVPLLVSALARTGGSSVKQVLHQHNNAPAVMSSRRWKNVCGCLEEAVFVANKTQREAVQFHGKFGMRSRVIYNGVDLAHYDASKVASAAIDLRQRLGIPTDCSVLLFVGRLLPNKGVVESAEAFNGAGLTKSRMLIVGDLHIQSYRDEAYLRRLNQAAENSEGRLHLVGTVSQAELPIWYAASDVVIVPSIGAEGLPKIITEALAMGKPVLASDRGGSWELLREGQNGWLIRNPSEVESTAQLIKRVLSDRRALRNLSAEILERDRPLMSEDRMVQQFADVLADWCQLPGKSP